MISRSTLATAVLCLMVICTCADAQQPQDVDSEFFEKQIRPLFVEHCLECHGADDPEAGLRITSRKSLLTGGDSGPALLPGKPSESLLMRAVEYLGDIKMPPKQKLTDAQVRNLRQWIASGATWPETSALGGDVAKQERGFQITEKQRRWWAFQPVNVPPIPSVNDPSWARNEIDRFIAAGLESHGIQPAVPASREEWLRRATFDLLGLPPTPDEIDNFLADDSDQAFDRVVDRLLASTAYGQRWGRHWLDVVRYADYHAADPKARNADCEPMNAWRYRDWVVRAFNHDMPFDDFIVHQIAGDLLPPPAGKDLNVDGLIATTFLSNGSWDRGDADKEKLVSDMVDDNIDTIGKAFLGLTFGCARCHDHKFDPIAQRDYYGLAGIFYSTHVLASLGTKGGEYKLNRVPLLPASELARRDEKVQQLAQITARIDELEQSRSFQSLTAGGKSLVPAKFASDAGATGKISADGSVTVSGRLAKDTYRVQAVVPEAVEIRSIRLEALSDATFPSNGPGRAGDGNFVVTKFSAAYTPPGSETPIPIAIVGTKADFSQSGFAVAAAHDDRSDTGWAIHPAMGRDHVAAFTVAPNTRVPAGAVLSFAIAQEYSETHTLGKFRLSLTNELVATPPKSPDHAGLELARDRLQEELSAPIPVADAAGEGGTKGGLFPAIQDVPIHIRGSYTRMGTIVSRRMPAFFAGEAQPEIRAGSGRRELAMWIASKTNPLTARVIVNRVWQWHFGAGLVRTPNNFGLQSEPPSHPELLDWLAVRFVEDGWSLKKLHRRIMLSTTYRQSSKVDRSRFEKDAENRWFGRFVSRRLEAEAIRDAILSASGRLDHSIGGPAEHELAVPRRSLYVQTARWDRENYLTLFDAANPDSSVETRAVSTVAPQSLFLLNNQFLLDEAKRFADRLSRESPQDETARIKYAFRLALGRLPRDQEIAVARKIVATGDSANDGWRDLAHILMCTNEFIYID